MLHELKLDIDDGILRRRFRRVFDVQHGRVGFADDEKRANASQELRGFFFTELRRRVSRDAHRAVKDKVRAFFLLGYLGYAHWRWGVNRPVRDEIIV